MNLRFTNPTIPLLVIPFKQADISFHQHEFTELVLITGGKGLHVTSTQRYPIMAGDVFVVKRGEGHSYQATDGLSLINILFYEELLRVPDYDIRDLPGYHALFCIEPIMREKHASTSKLNLDLEKLAWMKDRLLIIERELKEKSPGYRYTSISLLMTIIVELSQYYSKFHKRDSSTRFTWRIAKVISYLETHYQDAIQLDALVDMAHTSASSLRRAFIETTQTTPIDYLIRLRLDKAKELLRNTRTTISEIAFEVGFSDSNYFTRQFKKFVGVSPRSYRTSYAEK